MAYSKNRVDMEIEIQIGRENITIKKGEPLRLISANGFFAPNHEIGTEDHAGNGGRITGRRYGMRELGITFGIADLPETEAIRSEVMHKLKAHRGCTITATRNGRTGQIRCEITGEPEISQPNYTRDRASVSVNFIAEEPFFKNKEETKLNLSAGKNSIRGQADAPTAFAIDFEFSGDVSDIHIENEEGQKITIYGDFKDGDRLSIESGGSSRAIYKNGEAYFRYDIRSEFFDIYPGESTVTIGTGSGEGMNIRMRFFERYLGI